MTADQLNVLIGVISGAVQTLGWVIGIAVSIFLVVFGGALGVIFRQNSERVTDVEKKALEASEGITALKRELSSHSTTCSNVRAKCREELLTKYVTDGELKEMEQEFKNLVQDVLKRLESQLSENRSAVVTKLDEFKRDVTGAVLNHGHDDDGSVIFRKNGGFGVR